MTKPFTVEQLRCLELARIIREGLEGVRFDMQSFSKDCGTAGCIGGYAVAQYSPAIWRTQSAVAIRHEATQLLGFMDSDQSDQMFAPWFFSGPHPSGITPAMAAATLENYALTGKVEWPKP